MSEVRPDIDLEGLARPKKSIPAPTGRWRRLLLPGLILLGFSAVVITTLGDLLRPVVDVSIVRPRLLEASEAGSVSKGAVVLQAAGWIEPDPFLTHVAALADGVVSEVLVQESDEVEAGDIVARMIEDDARIAHSSTLAALNLRQAELLEAEARDLIARERLEAALDVTEALSVATAGHAGKRAAARARDAAVDQGRARLELALDELVVQQELRAAGASGARQVELAEGAVDEARGRLAELEAQAALAHAAQESAQAVVTRAEADVELRFTDRLEAHLAAARVERARAEVRAAEADLEASALRLDRMTIRAQISGVVLERLTVPGMVLSVVTEGHAVCSLYDPRSLRVRVDVPQGDVGRLSVGQRAEVLAESRAGAPYEGEVIRIVQQADIQKVTLQAQVRLLDGDSLLRPEMLTQVRFYGTGDSAQEPGAQTPVLIPRRLVDGDKVWVVDAADGVARRRALIVGSEHGEMVEVLSGVNLTDKLIDEGRLTLKEGDHLRVAGEEN